jgi:tetratricopeptide (TPR) repeat protein
MTRRRKTSNDRDPVSSGAEAQMIDYFAAQFAASRVSEAVDAAQGIMFDAWECEDPRKRVSMARKALKASSDCADAYVLLAQETARTPGQAVELYGQGVAAGERALGQAAFKEDVGMFWGLLETRPYMRARLGLAMALWEAGHPDEAIAHGQEMLRLNPGDNQGVRYIVLNWLQQFGRDADADRLLRRYKDEDSTALLWPAALAAFRRHGDGPKSRKALARAVQANRHVAPFLLGRKKLPKRGPPYVAVGGSDEAAAYVEAAMISWTSTLGVLEWLGGAIDEVGSVRLPRGRDH